MTSATGVPIPARPCSADESVAVAERLVGHGVYQLGAGDCDTPDDDPTDCAGFAINKCLGVRRHRPGFNAGNPSKVATWDVEDDINSNSALGDAFGAMALFRPVIDEPPQEGDLLAYPTIRIRDAHDELHTFVGHVAIVIDASRWDGTFGSLVIAQCRGPSGRRPGIIRSSAVHFDDHDKIWPKIEHRTHVLRPLP